MAIFERKTESTAEKQSGAAPKSSSALRSILIEPRISEKATQSIEKGKYIFNVKRDTNKILVRKAVEQVYGVTVLRVNIINSEGKQRNYGTTSGKMADFKKAIVTLKAGQKIEIAE